MSSFNLGILYMLKNNLYLLVAISYQFIPEGKKNKKSPMIIPKRVMLFEPIGSHKDLYIIDVLRSMEQILHNGDNTAAKTEVV